MYVVGILGTTSFLGPLPWLGGGKGPGNEVVLGNELKLAYS